jgi:hypothetical protein
MHTATSAELESLEKLIVIDTTGQYTRRAPKKWLSNLVVVTLGLFDLKGNDTLENHLIILYCFDIASCKAASIANGFHLIGNRQLKIAAKKKIGMDRMR